MKAAPPLCADWMSRERQLYVLVVVWWVACDGSQWMFSLGPLLYSVENLGVTVKVVWCEPQRRGLLWDSLEQQFSTHLTKRVTGLEERTLGLFSLEQLGSSPSAPNTPSATCTITCAQGRNFLKTRPCSEEMGCALISFIYLTYRCL